ncbi:hypothetical protein [uncultured Cohaesibacter sp.]|uniref:hypothetical protein n=1 Tax=uncultured Cohaesibacter sp. TaxID=1002546 RepID=UPI002AA87B36|nr:hypothetical protein [uncultured Cohaesibacter sp.]
MEKIENVEIIENKLIIGNFCAILPPMQEKAWARFKPIRNEGYAEHRNVEEALEIALSDIPFSKKWSLDTCAHVLSIRRNIREQLDRIY